MRREDETPSFGDAADRVVEATRDVVEDRVRLLQLELRETGTRVGRGAGFLVAAGLLGLTAWWLLSGAGYVMLRAVLPPAASLGLVAAVNLALAALLAGAGASRLRRGS